MFAHCLLPALLLLAAVYSCTTYLLPPFKVTKIAGSRENVSFYNKMQFYIPKHRCDSILHMAQKEGLRCNGIGSISWVNVTVLDYRPDIQINLYDSLNIVQVIRQQDCSGVGLVSIRVGCQLYQAPVFDDV